MDNEFTKEENLTGFRFLVDAKSTRQYAVQYVDGAIVAPLRIFNGDPLKPNEVVFALDDAQVKDYDGVITTEVYKIAADETGRPSDIAFASVEFKITSNGGKRGVDAKIFGFEEGITAEDYKGFPLHYNIGIGDSSVPPQHQGGKANIARAEISELIAQGVVAPPRPSAAFNPPPPPYKFNPAWKVTDQALAKGLQTYGKNLTTLARARQLDPVIGRDTEVNQALKIMSRRKQSSLCFTGEAGVGKTAMFAAVAQRIVDDSANLPQSLAGAEVIQLDLQAMNAGSSLRGQFEEKLKPIIEGLAERNGTFMGKKLLIAIDELPTQLSAGAAQGTDNAGSMMKPFLTTKGVSVMGTTTDEEYKRVIEKDPALVSRFEKLRLAPPDEATTMTILKKLWPLTKEHNHLTKDLTEDELRYIVTMSNRYAPQEAQPRKGEKVINMAASSAEFEHRSTISKADIVSAVAQMSGLSVEFLSQNDGERFLKLETELPKEVLGQPGLTKITDGLIGARSGLNDPNQPWGCFVLQGPTGTGKTESCKALARYLFGNENAMIKLDMSDYQQEFDVSKLTGAPPGYVGFEDSEPALTERVRQQPYCILLLDEIEKAHPKVFDKFLAILNDGKMTDNHGKVVLFNNVIVMMTTNLGAKEALSVVEGKTGISFGDKTSQSPEKLQESLGRVYEKARGNLFRPEMINRIDELGGFITFIPLSKDAIAKIATREIAKINKRLSNADGANLPNVALDISESAMQQILKEGYNPAMGARPLRKVVREKVANPLGKWLMGHREEVEAFIKKEGSAKLVIDSLDNFAPVLAKATPAVVNDNAPVKKASARKKAAAPGQP